MMKQLTDLMYVLIAVSSLISLAGCTVGSHQAMQLDWDRVRIVDLTHSFGAETIVWPTEQDFKLIGQHAEDAPGGYYYASNRIEMPEHGGTHIDAPIHFSRGRQTLDQIPISQLAGAGVRINVHAQCARDRDYQVTVRDIEQWEVTHGRIPGHSIVLLDTGFAEFWPNRKEYLGTELRGQEGVRELHFPGVHPAAAAWLVRERQVKAVGIDTASIDYGQSTKFESHVAFLSQNVPVLENLADLRGIPENNFDVIALPMKIAGGTGGPLRVIAVLPDLK